MLPVYWWTSHRRNSTYLWTGTWWRARQVQFSSVLKSKCSKPESQTFRCKSLAQILESNLLTSRSILSKVTSFKYPQAILKRSILFWQAYQRVPFSTKRILEYRWSSSTFCHTETKAFRPFCVNCKFFSTWGLRSIINSLWL